MELILLAVSLVVIYTDGRYQIIPNKITFPLIIGGIVYHSVISGWPGLSQSGMGLLFGTIVFMVPFVLGSMGAGDVKFAAGLGACLGPWLFYHVFILSALLGAVFGLYLLLRKGVLGPKLKNYFQALIWFLGTKGKVRLSFEAGERVLIPYGVFLSFGAIITVLRGV